MDLGIVAGIGAKQMNRGAAQSAFALRRTHFICLLIAILCPAFSWAAIDNSDGITVSGEGTAKGAPTVVEISAVVSGEGELAADANVKYLDARKKGLAALDGLKLPDLSVESDGPAVTQAIDPATQQMIMNGQQTDANKTARVQVSESLRLVLKNADKLPPDKMLDSVLKIIDACRDAGIQIGGSSEDNMMRLRRGLPVEGGMVTFKLADKSDLEQQARQKAVADAKAKAKRLADLTGVQLGRVLSVDEEENAPVQNPGNIYEELGVSGEASATEIEANVHVTVKFEITR
jgi:uncharacterized protein YggE